MADRSKTARSEGLAGRRSPLSVDTEGRAYRAGRLVCECVHVTASVDERLGLAPQERQRFRARFREPLDDELRSELTELVRRRGAASIRLADDLEAIEIALEGPRGERHRLIGHLRPPQVRHGRLRDIEFEFGVKRTR
jgi:hypothetical protein